MICCHPITIKNTRGEYVDVPCGQCISCRLNFGRDWAVRITSESKLYNDNVFITLTYDDEHLPENGTLVKKDVQNFMKLLRKKCGKKVRFFLSGEYGDTFGRPHYHLIVFNLGIFDTVFTEHVYDSKHDGYLCKCSAWNKGNVYVGCVTVDSARYVAKYTIKKIKGKGSKEYYESLGIIPEFSLMSRRPGIGAEFADKYASELRNFGSVIQKGIETPLPRYFKNRVDYCANQEKLNKVNKNIDKWLGNRQGMTFHEIYEVRGNQLEENIRKGLRK